MVALTVEEWSIQGPNAELADKTDIPEKVLQVPLTMKLDQISMEAVKERIVKYFSTVKLGPLSVGAPKPEDVKITKKELKYVPFWRVYGTYACRYARRASYKLDISDDVEEVKIYGNSQQLSGQRRRLSDMISEVGASTGLGYGPIKVSLAPLQGAMKTGLQKVLGSKDKEFSRHAELTIPEVEELASYANHVRLCFNANLGGEDRKIFEALEKVPNFEAVSREVKEKAVGVLIDKAEVRNELKKAAVKEPDTSPSRIMEHEVSINKLDLVYVPFYDLIVEAKGQRKTIKLNALSGEDYEL